MNIRDLLSEIDPGNAHILDTAAPDDDLLAAGMDSASLVELALRLEESVGVPLRAQDIDSLTTLAGITRVLDQYESESTASDGVLDVV